MLFIALPHILLSKNAFDTCPLQEDAGAAPRAPRKVHERAGHARSAEELKEFLHGNRKSTTDVDRLMEKLQGLVMEWWASQQGTDKAFAIILGERMITKDGELKVKTFHSQSMSEFLGTVTQEQLRGYMEVATHQRLNWASHPDVLAATLSTLSLELQCRVLNIMLDAAIIQRTAAFPYSGSHQAADVKAKNPWYPDVPWVPVRQLTADQRQQLLVALCQQLKSASRWLYRKLTYILACGHKEMACILAILEREMRGKSQLVRAVAVVFAWICMHA